MKIKIIYIFLISVCFCFTGCNHDYEPPTETLLAIYTEYLPVSIEGNKSDADFINICKEWKDKVLIVNSVDDLPDDPIGFSKSYQNIGFQNQSLLITYKAQWWEVATISNMFVKNNVEKTFNWTISLGLESYPDQPEDIITLTRYAILVPKIPSDSDLKVWWSISDLNFEWWD